MSEDSPRLPHLLSEYCQRETDKSIVLNLHEFLNDQRCREIMERELIGLALTEEQWALFASWLTDIGWWAFQSMPSYHNVLNLLLRIEEVHKYTIRRVRDLSRVMQESFDAAALKVPAAKAAVEMVMREKVELNEMETCTICLEEVGEAVRMPCSHVFHGDCIGEWLRIDHCCPLCRLQMLIAMETSN